jgi:hypothetical protein
VALTKVKDAAADRKAAWDVYLEECNRIPAHDYDEREPFAWRRLRKRLREIDDYEEYGSA